MITDMLISNSMLNKFMPKNAIDAYVDIYMHGIVKSEEKIRMFNTRLFSIVRKEFVQIFRDPRSLALIIVMPIIQLFLLGYAATTDVKNVPMAVWIKARAPNPVSCWMPFVLPIISALIITSVLPMNINC
jgi:hypothetical protein